MADYGVFSGGGTFTMWLIAEAASYYDATLESIVVFFFYTCGHEATGAHKLKHLEGWLNSFCKRVKQTADSPTEAQNSPEKRNR